MRHLAIGDIHGCFTALTTLIDFIQPSDDDTLIMLGDYVDRGPDSHRVIQWLIDQSAMRNIICLKGNHELMMLEARDDLKRRRMWGAVGGGATWDSYSQDLNGEGLEAVPAEHWKFIEQCLPYHETETHVFVHAAIYGDIPLTEQPDYMLFWEKFGSITPVNGKIVVCGHTSQKDGVPKNVGHAICIDTWAHGDGWLTCLDVGSGKYYQANQSGQTRSDWLDEPD